MPRSIFERRVYSEPDPFVSPAIFQRPNPKPGQPNAVVLIPFEAFSYAGKLLEEIMFQINREFNARNEGLSTPRLTRPTWKKYLRANGPVNFKVQSEIDANIDSETFNPKEDGSNLSGAPLKFYPLYVKDIQAAIDTLINDPLVPDTRKAYFARIFTNNQKGKISRYNNGSKIKNDIKAVLPSGMVETVAALNKAKSGDWPFNWSDRAVMNIATINPIGMDNRLHPNVVDPRFKTPGGLETTAEEFPNYGIGAKGADGKVAGFDGVEMTNANAPKIKRLNALNTSTGQGAGLTDYSSGYSAIAHQVLSLQQLRYDGPDIEWWPFAHPTRYYSSNRYSNTTPNLTWVLSQPVERLFTQNWSQWLGKGEIGFLGAGTGAHLRAYDNPSAAVGGQSNCPFLSFLPATQL